MVGSLRPWDRRDPLKLPAAVFFGTLARVKYVSRALSGGKFEAQEIKDLRAAAELEEDWRER